MKEICTKDAVGSVLCHDITQRIFPFFFQWEKSIYLSGRKKKGSFTKMRLQRSYIRYVQESICTERK